MTPQKLPELIIPDPSFSRQVERHGGQKTTPCYQCEKCSNGCPVAFAMDILPHKVIRSVTLGLKDVVLKSDTIWVCASCETCSTRCPNGIDIAHVMDTLRQMAQHEGIQPSAENAAVPAFHSAFLSAVKSNGRIPEAQMVARYTLKTQGLRGLLKQAGMGLKMFRRGKVRIFPGFHAVGQVRKIFRAAGQRG
ncbi:MAG: 4Fe-4S dicluster domain-containing protein [Chloroflexi bacterium]|nr:4Fe-4S dicluster domain-containing protein [Chloroflexota bacterium]